MKTRQPMIKDRAVMHKRISQLCNYLNANNITNYTDLTSKLQIGKWHFMQMAESGIVYKEGNNWKGAERLTQQRLDKFVELCREYQRENLNKPKVVGQVKIKFPKSTAQVTDQVTAPVAKTRKLRKVSLIKRIKFLFTGKI